MKHILRVVFFLSFSLSGFAQDPGSGNSVQEFRTSLQRSLDETRAEMEVRISSRRLEFSDYKEASQLLLQRIDQSSHHFKNDMQAIEDFLSWYDSVSSASRSKPDSRALKRLLEMKKNELKELRESYKKFAQLYVMLGSHLAFPVGFETYTTLNYGFYTTHVRYIDMYQNNIFSFKEETIDSVFGNAENLLLKFQRDYREIFSACKSQGCVFQLSEDIAHWIKASQKLVAEVEVPIKGICDLEASKPMSFRKIQKVLDFLASNAARGKPVSAQ